MLILIAFSASKKLFYSANDKQAFGFMSSGSWSSHLREHWRILVGLVATNDDKAQG